MKRTAAEKGSLAAVIIAVLFVALMATLGVVFYQNFIEEKPAAQTHDNKPATTAPQEKTARVAFNSAIYAFDYPDNWKLKTEKIKDSAMGGSLTTATSSDGKVQAELTVSEKKPEIACDATDSLKISSYKVGGATADKLVGLPLYMVEALVDVEGGGYQYTIGLVPDGGDTHAAVGQTHCNVSHVGTVSAAAFNGQKLTRPTILAAITFPELPKSPKPAAKDMQTIKALMKTDDYKAAVKALESMRKE